MADLSEVYSAILSTKLEEDHTSTYNDRLFGWFRSRYKCVFEGLEDPVFYRNFYIKSLEKTDSTIEDYHSYRGTNYSTRELYRKNEFYHNYIIGLKDSEQDLWRNQGSSELTAKYHDDYLKELSTWFSVLNASDPGKVWGVMTVPSSKVGATNEVTKLVHELLSNYQLSNFIDFTANLYRTKDKTTTYGNGVWDVSSNINTLDLQDPALLEGVDNLVLIDDVITTGSTLSAVKTVLNNNRVNSVNIYNYVFGKTVSFAEVLQRSLYTYDPKTFSHEHDKEPVKGIIYDLDQTLIDSHHRNEEFEKKVGLGSGFSKLYDSYCSELTKNSELNENEENLKIHHIIENLLGKLGNVYELYPEIISARTTFNDFFNLPFAIVTDNSSVRANVLAQTNTIQATFYGCLFDHFKTDHNFLGYGSCENPIDLLESYFDTYYGSKQPLHQINCTSYPLKSIYSASFGEKNENVRDAKKELCVVASERQVNGRIVGIGNTEEDMIAYHQAGIEACLALWGVHPDLREHALKAWNADYVFDDFREFCHWIVSLKSDRFANASVEEEAPTPTSENDLPSLAGIPFGNEAPAPIIENDPLDGDPFGDEAPAPTSENDSSSRTLEPTVEDLPF